MHPMIDSHEQSQSPSHAIEHHEAARSRRDFLLRAGAGFGSIALTGMLEQDGVNAAGNQIQPSALAGRHEINEPQTPKRPHHKAKAKACIFIFIEGGPSHIDLFDPKPLLDKMAGQKIPSSFKPLITPMGEFYSPLLGCKRKWKQHGQSGTWVSDWLPHIATLADDIGVLRSCVSDGLNHVNGVQQMNTGSIFGGRPSLGSWTSYGLGNVNQDLPSFVVLLDKGDYVTGGSRNWSTAFMPSTYQGTRFRNGMEAVSNLNPPKGVSNARQRAKLDFLAKINRKHMQPREDYSDLDARIRAYELAYRMQAAAPEAVDLSKESESTKEAYGLNDRATLNMGRQCLLARRLVERGTRFVQIYSGAGSKWDAHSNIEGNHTTNCKAMDQPVAALVHDLKQRGMLDETLIVWGGEFGRTPMSEKGTGRDHNPWGFTMWFAGGDVKPGNVVGKTDDLGLHAIEDRAHVHSIHATVLHLLGIDHTRLIYRHNGIPERATVNEGHVVKKLLA